MRTMLSAAVFAAAMGTCASASASMTLTYDRVVVGDNVATIGPAGFNEVGEIQLYDGGNLVATAFSMDTLVPLAPAGTYDVLPYTLATVQTGLPGVPTDLTAAQLTTIATLVNNGPQDNASPPDYLSGGWWNQMAIWSTENATSWSYDATPYCGTDNLCKLHVAYWINQTIANANLNPVTDVTGFAFLVSTMDPNQTLVFEMANGVPEPSTWAMGLIGFGLMAGLAAFTRRKAFAVA